MHAIKKISKAISEEYSFFSDLYEKRYTKHNSKKNKPNAILNPLVDESAIAVLLPVNKRENHTKGAKDAENP